MPWIFRISCPGSASILVSKYVCCTVPGSWQDMVSINLSPICHVFTVNHLHLHLFSWLVVWNIFYFPYIGFLIIPLDFHILQRGGPTTNQKWYFLMAFLTVFQGFPWLPALSLRGLASFDTSATSVAPRWISQWIWRGKVRAATWGLGPGMDSREWLRIAIYC